MADPALAAPVSEGTGAGPALAGIGSDWSVGTAALLLDGPANAEQTRAACF